MSQILYNKLTWKQLWKEWAMICHSRAITMLMQVWSALPWGVPLTFVYGNSLPLQTFGGSQHTCLYVVTLPFIYDLSEFCFWWGWYFNPLLALREHTSIYLKYALKLIWWEWKFCLKIRIVSLFGDETVVMKNEVRWSRV